ncbi:MAG TPA: DUF6580 family putative transport protein [Candidatus Nanoarchaeia archaeon]|nr:hypothetical protein [uncultured archaeon]
MQKILEKLSNPLIFVLIAATLRVVPHAPNFAPIGAMALFGGAYLGRKWAIALPLVAMFLSDLFIGFDSLTSRLTVYGSFALIGLIGMWLKNHRSFQNVVLAALGSSVLFFVTTNFGVWAFGTLYPKTAEGLVACFVAAIPFFRNTLMGDLFYTTVFFGGYELVKALVKSRKLAVLKG